MAEAEELLVPYIIRGGLADAGETVVPIEFRSEFKLIWPIAYGVDPKPWKAAEKQKVRDIVAGINRQAPGLMRRVTAYRSLVFYRGHALEQLGA